MSRVDGRWWGKVRDDCYKQEPQDRLRIIAEGAVGLRLPDTTCKATRGDLAGSEPSPVKLQPPARIASSPPSLQTPSG